MKIVKNFWLIILIYDCLKFVICDKSDDECRIIIENEQPANATSEEISSVRENLTPKQKKSLVIAFDTTGSMSRDLQMLKDAAKEITQKYTNSEEGNPIENYILSEFNDPLVKDPYITTNPSELMAKIDAITIGGIGNDDCPELAFRGLLQGIEKAYPNSYAYVITDASAKDHHLMSVVTDVVQKKQVTVDVIKSTSQCEPPSAKETYGYKVYGEISRLSGGQFFEVDNRDEISQVLTTISNKLNDNYVKISSFDFKKGTTNKPRVNVDSSFTELTVSVSGSKALLQVKNSKNEIVAPSKSLSSTDNMKFMSFPVVNDSVFEITASADSDYSIRIGGISELHIGFGFSVDPPERKTETSPQPLINSKNYLSIFISNPEYVKCLITASIVKDSGEKKDLQLVKKGTIYLTAEAFDVPSGIFKIHIHGYDKDGNIIDRLISTGIQSVAGFAPTVSVEHNYKNSIVNQFSNFAISCKYNSLTPTVAKWSRNGVELKSQTSRQSHEMVIYISNFNVADVGTYKCEVSNNIGKASDESKVDIRLAPVVNVLQKDLNLIESAKTLLECEVTGTAGEYSITWKSHHSILKNASHIKHSPFKDTFELEASRIYHNQTILCEVEDEHFKISDKVSVSVQYSPSFPFAIDTNPRQTVSFDIGLKFELICDTEENPEGKVNWYYFKDRTPDNKTDLNTSNKRYEVEYFKDSLKGNYVCEVENFLGKASKTFKVLPRPVSIPDVVVMKYEEIFREDQKFQLECSCTKCLPIKGVKWVHNNFHESKTYTGKKFLSQEVNEKEDKFASILKFDKAERGHRGEFTCYLENKLGTGEAGINVKIHSEPKEVKIAFNDALPVKSYEVNKFEDLKIECSGSGSPAPKFSIIKDGKVISSEPFLLKKSNDLMNVNGHYSCMAQNTLGQAESMRTHLTVKIRPQFKTTSIPLTTNFALNENDKVKLDCDVIGIPEPEVSWTYRKELNEVDLNLSKNPLIKSFQNGKVLEVISNNSSTKGTYSCTASNGVGNKIERKFNVDLKVAPWLYDSKPEIYYKKLGWNMDFSCAAYGNPDPTFIWKKDGETLQTEISSRYFIGKIEKEDFGKYSCEASNILGTVKKSFEFYLRIDPKISSNFSPVKIFYNETKFVECKASGNPSPDFTWKLNGVEISNKAKLKIDVSFDSGTLECIANNHPKNKTLDVKKFELEVIRVPELTENSAMKTLTLNEGDSLVLECPVRNHHEIEWNLREKVIDEKYKTQKIYKSSSITLKDDAGYYDCKGSNMLGSVTFTYEIIIKAKPKADIVIKNIDHFSDYYKPHSDLIVECKNSGNPKPKISWFLNNILFSHDEIIEITNLGSSHEGTLSCRAENILGEVVKDLDIVVGENPEIEDFYADKDGNGHQNVSCTAHGYPLPTITIQDDSGVFIRSDRKSSNHPDVSVVINENVVKLQIVSRSFFRTENLKCTADNKKFKQDERQSQFHHKEKEIFLKFKNALLGNMVKLEIYEGDEIELDCENEGYPESEINWYIGNQEIRSDSKVQSRVNNNQNLILREVQTSQDVVCRAYNRKSENLIRRFRIETKSPWEQERELSVCSVECGSGYQQETWRCADPTLKLCNGEATKSLYHYCEMPKCEN